MALRDLPRKLSYEDYVLFPEDGQRHEILDGEHYVTPSPFFRHQHVASELHLHLGRWVKERKLGVVVFAPMDVLLSPHDVAQPDLLFISNERAGIITEKNIHGAPDLVVEILSKSTRQRDERLKLDRYDRFGEASGRAAAAGSEDALDLSKLALSIAERVPGPEKDRIQGYCWALVACACRAACDLPGANEALARARGLWRAGSDREALADWPPRDLEAFLAAGRRGGSDPANPSVEPRISGQTARGMGQLA